MKNRYLVICLLISLVGIIWSFLFISQSSYIGLDGHGYFGLADDAMISMRYAWNFAHGQGLVWNPGQRVEGYSNLLMTLVMSVAALLLNKPLAVFAVQIFGVVTLLSIAFVVKGISDEVNEGERHRELTGILAVACVFSYFPLTYWTLMGMETGLVTLLLMGTLLFGLRWQKDRRNSELFTAAILAGMAFLTRNDSLIFSGLILAFLLLEAYVNKWERLSWLPMLQASSLYLIFPIAQTIFRLIYYGQLESNTYALKLTHFPISVRLSDGLIFVTPFLQQTAPALLLGALAVLLGFKRVRVLLFSFILAALAYQVFVGGDPWPSWRVLAPAMPALFLLALTACSELVSRWRWLASRLHLSYPLIMLVCLGILYAADLPFLPDMAVRAPTSAAIANRVNTNTAIAINHMTFPGASVGVIWAGTLPYYTDREGVDFLGKSDAYIAHLNADVSGAVSWGGMRSVPGHNKYDLDYSIAKLQPTYIQGFAWGDQIVKPWVTEHYVRVEYHGINGMKTLFLQKDSRYVCWDGCGNDYKIIPWPK
jgi:arabinofuranosyltransferase